MVSPGQGRIGRRLAAILAARIRRREVIALLGGAAIIWPIAVSAEQATVPLVGLLTPRATGEDPHLLAAFREGLKGAGYVEGQNVAIEYRFAENQYNRLPALVAELVQRQVSVIATFGAAASSAAKTATTTIPVIFVSGADPIGLGFVESLNRPGGNLTGLTQLTGEVAPKRLELLHEIVPTATYIILLVNPKNPLTGVLTKDLAAAAHKLGLRLHMLHASTDLDLQRAFAEMEQSRAGGLVIASDAFFNSRSQQLAELTIQHTLPAIYQYRKFVAAGGLLSYGGSITDAYREAGVYVARVLKGEKPADMPVQQATKVELIINLKTAKALGINVPLDILGRADEVIE